MIKSIYIHIPFCRKICTYCDFCKAFYNKEYVNKYLDSLEQEIKNTYKNECVETIYIGGGTPSCLDIDELNKLFGILNIINKDNLKEFTIECNIEDIDEEKLKLFKDNHINRISIGLQTTNKEILKTMNRSINIDVLEKINLVKKYFDNINIDLMYGFTNQDITDIDKDIDLIIDLGITHISTYSLILEENTKLYINKYKRINDDKDYEIYKYICKKLEENDYIHYEISNFCKKGYESNHNLCYWNNENYYGFGLGSSGYIDNIRYTNTKSINKYLNNEYVLDKEYVDLKSNMEYEMILGLRKLDGVNKDMFYNKFSKNIEDIFDIIDMKNKNLLEEKNGYIRIPKDKLYIENSILINFVGGSSNE